MLKISCSGSGIILGLGIYALLLQCLMCSYCTQPVDALSPPTPNNSKTAQQSRRDILVAASFGLCSSAVLGGSSVANAFPNHVADYAKYTEKSKRRGTPPKDLGIKQRTTEGEDDAVTELGLRSCDGNPNCFSTTGDFSLAERQQYGVDYLIKPWPIKGGDDPKQAFQTLISVVKAYEPGQGGVDGGGFGIEKETESYLYVQFESLKKGFIDDVEFSLAPASSNNKDQSVILVRSASRLGFTDFGVNAVRLNYIASKLRADHGWNIPEITPESHRDYWNAASDAREATFDSDRRQMDGA